MYEHSVGGTTASRIAFSAVLAVLLAGCAMNETATPPASPDPIAVASPPIAAGEAWVLYQAFWDEIDLALVRPDGSEFRRISGGPGNRWHPDWSPDGEWIAYDHVHDEVTDVWMTGVDGSEDRALTSCTGACRGMGGATWAPDGTKVGFDSAEGPTDTFPDGVCWIGTVEVDTGSVERIAEIPGCAGGGDDGLLAELLFMDFSPDGQMIAVEGRDANGRTSIFTMTAEGEELTRITEWGLGARPDWSPDGEWITFMSAEASAETQDVISVHRARADGSGLEQLTHPEGTRIDVYPEYTPDRTGIMYSRCPEPEAAVCEARLLSADGSDDELLFTPEGANPVHLVLRPGTE
ncbi:TolB family protein [Agromyces laixinhei]|uniref:TolB family protein n=1 Tax=Agromyces laixinhei TaxID=2585717 RepID=UPI0011168BA5|nr:PD40 domain-containing protein [Agromyces laixinhei]